MELTDPARAELARERKKRRDETSHVRESLIQIANWIEKVDEPLEAAAEQAINSILATYQKKSQITMVALAHYHLKKIVDWLEQADVAEQRLNDIMNDPEAELSTEELRRTIELHHKRVVAGMEFIGQLVEKLPQMPKAIHEDDEKKIQKFEQGEESVFDTPLKRDRAKRLIDSLARSVEDIEDGEVLIAEVVPTAPVGASDLFAALKRKLNE